jgi:hypothetical protein
MWHYSVYYKLCYCMYVAGDVTSWCQSMRDFFGVAFPSMWVAGGRYINVGERDRCRREG